MSKLAMPDIANSTLFEPKFTNVVTLDPSCVEDAWDRLSEDTLVHELASLDKIILLALYKSIQTSPVLNEQKRKNKKQLKKNN